MTTGRSPGGQVGLGNPDGCTQLACPHPVQLPRPQAPTHQCLPQAVPRASPCPPSSAGQGGANLWERHSDFQSWCLHHGPFPQQTHLGGQHCASKSPEPRPHSWLLTCSSAGTCRPTFGSQFSSVGGAKHVHTSLRSQQKHSARGLHTFQHVSGRPSPGSLRPPQSGSGVSRRSRPLISF